MYGGGLLFEKRVRNACLSAWRTIFALIKLLADSNNMNNVRHQVWFNATIVEPDLMLFAPKAGEPWQKR